MFKPEAYIDSVLDLLDDEQTLVAENIVKSPLDMQERYMSLVPDELLDFIVKQWRPGMTSDQADQIFKKYSTFKQGGSVTTPKRGFVDEPGSYSGKPKIKLNIKEIKKLRDQGLTTKEIANKLNVSTSVIETRVKEANLPRVTAQKLTSERLKYLDEAAKKYGYKDFASVKGRVNRLLVAKDATRRQENIPEGKGSPGKERSAETRQKIKESHWSTKSKKEVDEILDSPKYKEYWKRKTQNQSNILEAVKSGKYKTSEEIRKAVNIKNKGVFNKEVNNLFKNVYSQIGSLNKPKKVQPRFGVSFLPKDLEELYEIRSKLGQIDGFESTEQRNIYSQIEQAYGQLGETPNRKAYQESVKKASDFSRIKNAIKSKYPGIVLELDHPLDYKTIEGIGKKGEKFLYVTPIDRSLNRGFKEVLGKAYRTAVNNKDIETISKIENFAKDIGVTVGKVRGSKVMDYGTSLLRETDIGNEIISNLRQQNVIADKLKTLQKSGELKTIFKDIGMPRGAEKGFNIKGVSEAKLKGIENLIKKIGCTGLEAGGRVGFETGANCLLKGVEKINSGNIRKGAEARNFAKFANQAYKLGRGVLKYGIVPEAIFIGAESLLRMGAGETLDEALKRATSYLPGGTAREESANISELNRLIGKDNAAIVLGARKFINAQNEYNDLVNSKNFDLAISSSEGADVEQQIEEKYKPFIDKAKEKLELSTISEPQQLKARELEATQEDIAGTRNLYTKFIRGNIGREIEPDESLLSYDLSFPEITQEDLNKKTYGGKDYDFSAGEYYPMELMQSKPSDILKFFPDDPDLAQELIDEQERVRKLPLSAFDSESILGFNIAEPISRSYKYNFVPAEQGTFASGGLASLTRTIPPKRGPNHQGLASLPKYGKQY